MILCTAPREVPARLAEICAPGTLYLLLVITESLDVALHHTTKEVVIKTPRFLEKKSGTALM